MTKEFYNKGSQASEVEKQGSICVAKSLRESEQFCEYMNYLQQQMRTQQGKRLLMRECNHFFDDKRGQELYRLTNAYRRPELK